MYLLGYDIGSSSIKVSIVDADTRSAIGVCSYPKKEMGMVSHQAGWAEQHPEEWWKHACDATKELLSSTKVDPAKIRSIGISYQMHGLVCVDKDQKVIRPSIIWCDSRSVDIGNAAFDDLGHDFCYDHYLNSPGNFTASKLAWVKNNEPEKFAQIDKVMLPGDFIAMKMTGEICSTISGMSEGIFWDFKNKSIAKDLLANYGIEEYLMPVLKDTFSDQGKLNAAGAAALNLVEGIPVSYRAGDQPNNALSLGVFEPGDVAGTGGTSGVIYAVTDKLIADHQNSVNSFAHVNYTADAQRVGVLLCINGAGSMYAWMRNNIASSDIAYELMEKEASMIPIGSDGLSVLPFGNGAERMFQNKNIGAQFCNLQLNRHSKAHMYRATLEGIAFAFVYGIEGMNEMGIDTSNLKVGNDNLFRSDIFSQTIANITQAPIRIIETTGATGAALGSGYGIGYYAELKDAFQGLKVEKTISPEKENQAHIDAYNIWKLSLNNFL